MIRAVKLSLKCATSKKLEQVFAVHDRQVSCVNRFIRHIWFNGGSLDKETKDAILEKRLSSRYKSSALNQALSVVSATKASQKALGNKAACPKMTGVVQLANTVAVVERNKDTKAGFSYWVKLSTLSKGKPIYIPLKGTVVLDKWLSKPGATLKPSIGLNKTHVYFYVEIPDTELKQKGKTLAVDIGINKMLVDSDGVEYGKEFKEKVTSVRNCVVGSKNREQAATTRDNYIRQTVNALPWNELSTLVVENLKKLKHGKKKNRGKNFRKAMAPWTYAYVLKWISQKADEHRVRVVSICPSYTSQTCPKCQHVARSNRANEEFKCCRCGYTNDADHVGAINLLARFTGSSQSPDFAPIAILEAKTL